MRFSWLLEKSSLLSSVFGATGVEDVADSSVKQVAIIGAGAAGSSAAYHLRRYAEEAGIPLNITVFEKTGHIGGRTLTVNVYDDPLTPVELGASIFIEANHILFNATRAFNLSTDDPGTNEDGDLAIWDGYHFRYRQSGGSLGWWELAKLFWKYGTAPYYTKKLTDQTIATFLRLYDEPNFPFRSLSERAYELGLTKITGVTGEQFLAENKLDTQYAKDIVQASTRVNYASNLAQIHGLGTMVSMAPEGAMQIAGGNWQIFSKMIEASGARILLNSSVSSIELKETPSPSPNTETASTSESVLEAKSPKYVIKTARSGSGGSVHSVAFDDVIIATPYQFSGIKSAEGLLEQPIDEVPYATLHVTLFATPHRFSPEFFGLAPGAEAPASVLTTLPESDEAEATAASFYSATRIRVVTNPQTGGKEYVYKIFSPETVTPEFLSALLGVSVPNTFTGPAPATEDQGEDATAAADPISWYHPALFNPYPIKHPRVTFQDPILNTDGLYYTSGMDSFISTMETNALMGMNVARLIVDDYVNVDTHLAAPLPEQEAVVEAAEPSVAAAEVASDASSDAVTDTETTPETSPETETEPAVDTEAHVESEPVAEPAAETPEVEVEAEVKTDAAADTPPAVQVEHEQHVVEELEDEVITPDEL